MARRASYLLILVGPWPTTINASNRRVVWFNTLFLDVDFTIIDISHCSGDVPKF